MEVAHRPGELARALRPLVDAGTDLQVVMGYAEGPDRGVVEIAEIKGRAATAAARRAGLTPSPKPTLLIEGADRPGRGYEIANALAEEGVSISFLVAQVAGRKYSAVLGFHDEDAARRATRILRKMA